MFAEGIVDSHCHVGEPEYDDDREGVLARARQAGVKRMIVVAAGGDLETNRRVIDTARRESDCDAVVGIHPHDTARLDDTLFDAVAAFADDPAVVGIGETGLDYYYDHSPREVQEDAFRRFVALAREKRLPLVVHSRNADDETLRILREEKAGPGVMHCFTYGPKVARRVLDLGFSVSFSGVVTFRKAHEVREAARIIPADRLLVETDCPYLAPEPKRGVRNEPARVVDVAAGLAAARSSSLEEVAALTARNALSLFVRAGSS